jgi:glycogen debranching enzyme
MLKERGKTPFSRPMTVLRPRSETVHVSQNRAVLSLNDHGFIERDSDHGFFIHETRLVSHYRLLINGEQPQRVLQSNVKQHSWLGYYILYPPGIPAMERDHGSGLMEDESERTLELRLSRFVGSGMHEDIDLCNFSQWETSFVLALEVDADFRDIAELGRPQPPLGTIESGWRSTENEHELCFHYRAERRVVDAADAPLARIDREVTVTIDNSDDAPDYRDGVITWKIRLAPRQRWHSCINVSARIEDERLTPVYKCRSFLGEHSRFDRSRNIYLSESTTFTAPFREGLTHVVCEALSQAKEDLAGLRLYDLDLDERAWTVAAGLPIFVALFGRDTLTAGWEAALCGPEILKGTLPLLARFQGKKDDPWRDEEPGKMLHEAHTGPSSVLGLHPRERYYGAATTSAFYPVVLSEMWHWTGDLESIYPLVGPTLRIFDWLEKHGDLTGDGFVDYKTRSRQGSKHQGWKDSDTAIVNAAGEQIEPPIATCEEQGFVYAAWLHFSEILWWIGKKEEARRLFHRASELKKRFNERFWMEEQKFIALGIGPDGRLIDAITSNPGHTIATGIIDSSLAKPVADRLLSREMFSGWGIRTLSADNPAFNPYSYHRGSVWPVEHGTFALGFMRYGLIEPMQALCKGMFDAASLFQLYRLPEVLSGHPRDDDHPFPSVYPRTNWPQAWSSSAMFCMVQALLGIYPYAPLKLLLVDPQLPDWLPEITLENLRVGQASANIRFYRDTNGRSSFEVLEKRGALRIVRQPSPWSLTAGFGERFRDLLESAAA